jgi:hypothetical protein
VFLNLCLHVLILHPSRMLSAKTATNVSSVRHQVEILELQKVVSRNIFELRRTQRVLMPGLGPVLDEISDDDTADNSFKLLLPSELSAEDRIAWCLPDIPTLEFRFRYAQADHSLAELRRLLRLLQTFRKENNKHLSLSQKAVTRTRGLFDSFRTRSRRFTIRYIHAYNAMRTLDPDEKLSPGWMKRFKKLNDIDVRGPGREAEDTSEGKFTPSWIWMVPRSTAPAPPATVTPPSDHISATTSIDESTVTEDPGLDDSMRAHWAKCQARAERYEEEVALTVEEMGRTLRYFEWKKSWWLSLQSERENSNFPPTAGVQRGLRAYAHRQANVYDTLILSFLKKWRKTLRSLKLSPAWLSRYPAPTTADPQDLFRPTTHCESTPTRHTPPPLPSALPDSDNTGTSEMEADDDGDDDDSDGNSGGDSDYDEDFDNVEMFDFDLEDEFLD